MGYKQNLHTHCVYCDGKDTPEEMVLAAIERGFDSLGFSSHSYLEILKDFALTEDSAVQYKKEIRSLQDKYKDQIAIYCGLELDYNTPMDTSGYDYIIGSVHYMQKDGHDLFVDWDTEKLKYNIENVFNGDSMEYVRYYYSEVAKLANCKNVDILAHFDLVTKFCERVDYFDRYSEEYLHTAVRSIDALSGSIPFFEVNCGAISRGYRTEPYPSEQLLSEFRKRDWGVVITTDCHNKDYLDHWYEKAKVYLAKNGFTHHHVLTQNGFQKIPLFE